MNMMNMMRTLLFWIALVSAFVFFLGCDDAPEPDDAEADTDGDADADGDVYSDADDDDGADADEEIERIDRSFPEGFLFGTATSGFQVEMGCPTIPAEECEDRRSDWYTYITAPETVESSMTHQSGHPPSYGPGHYELYEDDIALAAQELHNNGMRISLEWSRIFPAATDDAESFEELSAIADWDEIAHYHDVLAAIRAAGMEPLVTLNHYSLPVWIHDTVACHQNITACSPAGWLDRERTVSEIAKYAGFVAQEFGADIDLWATLNEPFAVLLPGYIFPTEDRTNPPALFLRFEEARVVFLALIEAHARMYDAVKANDLEDADDDGESSMVGVVYAMAPARPADPSEPLDVTAAENLFYIWNMAYLNAVALGMLDDDLDGVAEPRDDLANRMDYLGINYYTRVTVTGTTAPMLPELSSLSTFDPFAIEPWEDYPRGIYEMAMIVHEQLGLPAIVTENGAEDPDDDGRGASYLVRHLAWVHQAVEEGADLRGYFYWTLMDNYEWNHGMDIRMGLYAVDPTDPTKSRVARQSVPVYGEIASTGTITAELSERFGAR